MIEENFTPRDEQLGAGSGGNWVKNTFLTNDWSIYAPKIDLVSRVPPGDAPEDSGNAINIHSLGAGADGTVSMRSSGSMLISTGPPPPDGPPILPDSDPEALALMTSDHHNIKIVRGTDRATSDGIWMWQYSGIQIQSHCGAIVLDACKKITLKCGLNYIEIDPSGISIVGVGPAGVQILGMPVKLN